MVLKFAQCDCLPWGQRPRAVVENFWRRDESSPSMAVRPASALERSFSCSSPPPPPLRRCCCCQPSRCTALHRAVTKLDDALPHGLQHRCESRSSTPTPHLSNRPSRSASRRRLPLRGAPCTQLLPARQSQRQPVGVHAAGQTTNCGPTFRARARRRAPPRRAAAPEGKNGPGGAQGEPDSPRRSTPKCSTGKTFFVGNLAKRVKPVSDHVDHEVFSLFTEAFLRIYPANVRPRRPGGPVATQC